MFQFQHFALHHEHSTLKIGTDSVLLASLVPVSGVETVLDIGCGCGVIAFCIGDRLKDESTTNQQVVGIDIDEASIAEARLNAQLFPADEALSFQFLQHSLQTYAPTAPHFQLIVSNPPFFSNSLKPTDEKRLRSKHRDHLLSFSTLTELAAQLLTPDGRFYVILPATENTDFEIEAEKHLTLVEKIAIQPVANKPINRYVLGFALQAAASVQTTTVIIRNADRTYTRAYQQLTERFYICFH